MQRKRFTRYLLSEPGPLKLAFGAAQAAELQQFLSQLLLRYVHQDYAHELSGRVLAYLENAEGKEPLERECQVYRLAWLLVLYASRGLSQPFERAFWGCFGRHPAKIWPELYASGDTSERLCLAREPGADRGHASRVETKGSPVASGPLAPKKPKQPIPFPSKPPKRAA